MGRKNSVNMANIGRRTGVALQVGAIGYGWLAGVEKTPYTANTGVGDK